MAKAKKSSDAAKGEKNEAKSRPAPAVKSSEPIKSAGAAKKPPATARSDAAAAAKSGPAGKQPAPGTRAPSTSPLIDTSRAAASAAAMLSAGINKKSSQQGSSARPESSLFKQLKSGLNKPASGAMNNLLDKTHGPSATKQHDFAKQVGRNQIIGADAARTGVPRRTNG